MMKTQGMGDRIFHSYGTKLFLCAATSLLCISVARAQESEPQAVAPPLSQAADNPENSIQSAKLYVYPSRGQTTEQTDRDRYECYVWAVEQTGFDPSQVQLAPHQRVEVLPAPGSSVLPGAVAGAVIGAVVTNPRRTGGGAMVGAVIGGVLGGATDAARAKQAEKAQKTLDEREAQRLAQLEEQSSNYKRAVTACLEGRGYTVK
jgi:hypothetical protein